MPELIGIARLAAESPSLLEKKRVEYMSLTTRSYLTRCNSPRMPFRWMINPYRGCEFGCKYCYARYTHEFMELRDVDAFEKKIFVKSFDPRRFLGELRKLPVGESIAIGTATDPYQPAEARYGVTRAMWEQFARTAGFRIGLVTKSDLVTRDAGVIASASRRHAVTIVVTITTLARDLAGALEPLAPRPELRLRAIRTLARAGIRVSVNLAPVLPLINDSEASLDAVAKAAAEAGAVSLGANVVYLKDCAKSIFFPFLEAQFPALAGRYQERFRNNAFLRGTYPEMIRERVGRIRRKYGLDSSREAAEPESWPRDPQLTLFS